MRQRPDARRREAGTAALETMVVMSFLFTLIFGVVHLGTFVLTKSMTNYAAFTVSRVLLVDNSRFNRELAGRQVMSEIQWWPGGLAANMIRVAFQQNQNGPRLADGRRRRGVRATYLLPFGYPIFRSGLGGLGLVRAIGFAPVTTPHTGIPEQGDQR